MEACGEELRDCVVKKINPFEDLTFELSTKLQFLDAMRTPEYLKLVMDVLYQVTFSLFSPAERNQMGVFFFGVGDSLGIFIFFFAD